MDALIVGGLIVASALASGAIVWFAMDRRSLVDRITALEKRLLQAESPAWVANMKLEHRTELLNVAALVKLAARDNLDALLRVSPGLADEVIKEIAPHLFMRDGIK